jgi:hypothetical protein
MVLREVSENFTHPLRPNPDLYEPNRRAHIENHVQNNVKTGG